MYRTGIQSPERVWWKPVHGGEKVWVAIAFAWCMVLFAMMPVWHLRGGQNPSGIRHRVEPLDYAKRVAEFIEQYKVGEESNLPVVEPPPGRARCGGGSRCSGCRPGPSTCSTCPRPT
jgi:hypothetical protein